MRLLRQDKVYRVSKHGPFLETRHVPLLERARLAAGPRLKTIGVDLASQPRTTAACVIEWSPDFRTGSVRDVQVGLDDQALLDLMSEARVAKIGIDAPFGWPVEFVEALVAYSERFEWPFDRSLLLLRATDREVKRLSGQRPLSVSTDRIAHAAMRCAGLLVALNVRHGISIDRCGTGRVVEVYPAAALRQWGFEPRGYRGLEESAVDVRTKLVDRLMAGVAGWLELSATHAAEVTQTDHAFDALVAALVARAAQLGQTTLPNRGQRKKAMREGWIHVPAEGSLS